MYGIAISNIGLVDDRTHGLRFLRQFELVEDLKDVADTEQTVGVQELLGLVWREVRGERTIGGASTTLVFARRACPQAHAAPSPSLAGCLRFKRRGKVGGVFECFGEMRGKRGGHDERVVEDPDRIWKEGFRIWRRG